MQTITRERAEDFVKYLEQVGTVKEDSHKDPSVIETIQAICALDDKEFASSEFASSGGANYFHSEYQDYMEMGEYRIKH